MPLYIQDTADAVLERKSDKFVIATGTTQTVTLKQKLTKKQLKAVLVTLLNSQSNLTKS